jgi:hypothetical protein
MGQQLSIASVGMPLHLVVRAQHDFADAILRVGIGDGAQQREAAARGEGAIFVAATVCPRCSSALNSACSRRRAHGRVSFETLMFSRGSLLSPYGTSPRFCAAQDAFV